MQRQMLKSKIHRATVTACDVDYVGSVTVDTDLLEAADILPNELVHIWDLTNGARVVTYALEGERGSGSIQINGAAALLHEEGNMVIIASYANYDEADMETYAPVVVHVDESNRAVEIDSRPEVLLTGSEVRA
jgi:aspartate 1-decarboxylase